MLPIPLYTSNSYPREMRQKNCWACQSSAQWQNNCSYRFTQRPSTNQIRQSETGRQQNAFSVLQLYVTAYILIHTYSIQYTPLKYDLTGKTVQIAQTVETLMEAYLDKAQGL